MALNSVLAFGKLIPVNFLFCEKTYRKTDMRGGGTHAKSLPGPHRNIVVSIDS